MLIGLSAVLMKLQLLVNAMTIFYIVGITTIDYYALKQIKKQCEPLDECRLVNYGLTVRSGVVGEVTTTSIEEYKRVLCR